MVNCEVDPSFELKPKVEKFEEKMTVKMIIDRIIEALLTSKIIYSFELIYSHGLVSGITSLSIFLLMRPKSLLVAGLAKFLVSKKYFVFIRKYVLAFFFINGACKF